MNTHRDITIGILTISVHYAVLISDAGSVDFRLSYHSRDTMVISNAGSIGFRLDYHSRDIYMKFLFPV